MISTLAFPVIFLCSVCLGIFLILKAPLAIKFQIWFYRKINWRIEPISMAREIRNTKIMGLLSILSAALALIYVLLR